MDLRCKGVVFGRHDLSKFDSLIEQVPGTTRWRTVPGLAILWRRLEEALIMMGTVVTEKSAARYVPLEYKLPPFPATFGYLRDHATSRYAMKAVRRSRSAFIPLVAWCACAFASAGDLRSYTPRWYRLLEDSGRVHQEWLNEMARNEIGDFSGNVKRVGVFVHLARCAWLSIIQVYINANVPIWFYWGNTRHGFVQNYNKNYDKWLQGYRPSPAAISDAIRKNQHQRETANRPDESPDDHPQVGAQDPLAPPESKFPRPVKHSGQRLGEHWREYFERVEKQQALFADKEETSNQRQSRLEREKRQMNHSFPGKKGPTCWRWELVDGFRIRTPVTRREVERIWDTIPNEHRRYNGFTNVWDINPEFDPNVDEDYFSDDDISEGYPSPIPRPPTSPNPVAVSVNPPPTDSHPEHHADSNPAVTRLLEMSTIPAPPSLIYDDLLETVGSTVQKTAVDVEAMEDALFFRYGLLTTRLSFVPTMSADLLAWPTLRNILGDCRATPGKSFCETVSHFVTCMLNIGDEGSKDALRELCDLHQELRDASEQNPLISVRIRRICFADNVIRYLLQPDMRSDWFVVFDNALSAVECLRRPEYKPEDIVSRLIRQGIPFRTIITGPSPPARRPPLFFFGLGYCQNGYKPTTVDYAAYERAQDDFLRGPRGRAALMKGGIVWRLAMQALHPDVVIAGPSESVYESGICFVEEESGKHWWDDDLTEDEKNLICGVYKVFTGKGLQTADMSWWPKQSAWERSGADFGYWSAKCEEWFQTRLTEIRDGKIGLRAAKHWNNALCFHKKTRRFLDINETLAARYLAGSPVF
jgi:hypothetical protein